MITTELTEPLKDARRKGEELSRAIGGFAESELLRESESHTVSERGPRGHSSPTASATFVSSVTTFSSLSTP